MKFVFFKLRYKKAQKKEKAFQVNLYHVFILGDWLWSIPKSFNDCKIIVILKCLILLLDKKENAKWLHIGILDVTWSPTCK